MIQRAPSACGARNSPRETWGGRDFLFLPSPHSEVASALSLGRGKVVQSHGSVAPARYGNPHCRRPLGRVGAPSQLGGLQSSCRLRVTAVRLSGRVSLAEALLPPPLRRMIYTAHQNLLPGIPVLMLDRLLVTLSSGRKSPLRRLSVWEVVDCKEKRQPGPDNTARVPASSCAGPPGSVRFGSQ